MTGSATAFDDEDLEILLNLYNASPTEDEPRRPPWTWSALNAGERAALARMIDVWVDTYNDVHATRPTDLLPPCWRHHRGLAAELAVQVWLWYAAHIHPHTTPLIAGEYYLRHLPGFRTRVDHLLGASPSECRRGEHPDSWRHDTDSQLAAYTTMPPDPDDDRRVDQLGDLHFGFPHLINGTQQRTR
jgi:hypothetical protein